MRETVPGRGEKMGRGMEAPGGRRGRVGPGVAGQR